MDKLRTLLLAFLGLLGWRREVPKPTLNPAPPPAAPETVSAAPRTRRGRTPPLSRAQKIRRWQNLLRRRRPYISRERRRALWGNLYRHTVKHC